MARGQDTRNHPNRGVSKNMFPFGGGEEHGYVEPDNFPRKEKNVSRGAYSRLARDLSTGFPQMSDDAPAGGIPRPKMHSCGSCGEMTSTEHGVCADCR